MIFYIATDGNGRKHVLTVETEAKKIDKGYVEIDQPNDKASLKKLLQDSFDHIFDLEQQIGGSAPAEGLGRSQEQVVGVGVPADTQAEPSPQSVPDEEDDAPARPSAPDAPTAPEPGQPELPDEEDEDILDVRVLERQVSALGIAGVDGLEQFDGWSQTVGISSAFNQGVHLLHIIASDDSQLAKIFLREQIKKRIKRRTY